MELKNITVTPSPLLPDYVRVAGEVVYDHAGLAPETYWYDVPVSYREAVTDLANPWAVCLLPLAMTLGENVRLPLAVDETLARNLYEWMLIFKAWYPHLSVIDLQAPSINTTYPSARKTVAFFSGGVDSFFTVLRQEEHSDYRNKMPVDDLLFVWGFDIPLSKPAAFHRYHDQLRQAAADLGKNLIVIATNLRTTQLNKRAPWGELYFSCAMTSVAHLLDKRFGKTLLSAGGEEIHEVTPWASTVITDPLLSSVNLKVVYDGFTSTRVERTKLVASSAVAQQRLHVCWRGQDETNCGRCVKCWRTLTTLEVLGVRSRFENVFPPGIFSLAKLRRVYMPRAMDRGYFVQIQKLARERGRYDIVQAIDQSLAWSQLIAPFLRICAKWKQFFWKQRFFWRYAEWPERFILRGMIHD